MKFKSLSTSSIHWRKNSLILRSSRLLDTSDRKKAILICVAYAVMGLLDVLGVLTIGIVGSLAVSGISASRPGNRVNSLLAFFGLQDSTLQVQVAILGLGAALILITKSIVSLYLTKRILFFLSRRSAYISKNLIQQLLAKDLLSVREKSIQETIFALTEGVRNIVVGVFGSALLLTSDIILLIIFGVTLFAIDTGVAISSLLFFSLLGITLYRFMHMRARRLGEQATQLTIASNNKISEIVNCYREILVKDRRAYYADQIGGMRLSIAEAGARLSLMTLLSKYIMEMAMVIGGLFVGAIQFITQPASRAVAVISIFLVASARIVPGVLRIQTGLISIKTAASSAIPTLELVEREFELDAIKSKVSPISTSPNFMHQGFIGDVEVRGLTFSYPKKKEKALSEVNLSIRSGEFVGIVGPSGSGKSTLVDLILGVIDSRQGQVMISNHDSISVVKKWPGAIGYVPQDASFISGTIKENICLGFNAEDISEEEFPRIMRAAQLDELLLLPLGINTFIGENGKNLSGGQRQRLGIARALFTNPQLLIMDEATSSLDAITESKLTEYFDTLKGKLTLIVIAHRLSTVKNADRIFYLDKGKILGEGTFEELRKKLPKFDEQASSMGISRQQ